MLLIAILNGLEAQPPVDSLLCHYPLNGSFDDFSGTNHGTSAGVDFGADRFGNIAHAARFDSTGDVVDFGDINLIHPYFSVSFWVSYDSINSGEYRILSKREFCSSGNFFDISVSDSATGMECYSGNNSSGNAAAGGVILYETWHHVVYVVDSVNQHTLKYIDGVLESTKPWQTQMGGLDNTVSLLLGSSPCVTGGSIQGYKGLFDDLRIYERPLTQAEVIALFNEPNPVVSVDEIFQADGMNVYPNPVLDFLYLDIKESDIKYLKIFDSRGITVLTETENFKMLNVSDLPAGRYSIIVNTPSLWQNREFIKR